MFALLGFYFSYQWWFNPGRAVKRQLGEVAAVLSVPAVEQDVARLARLARLRQFLSDDIHIRIGDREIASRDAILGAMSTFRAPAGGVDVQFVDTKVAMDSDTMAHASARVDVTTFDQRNGQPTQDSEDATLTLEKREDRWVITGAAAQALPTSQIHR
jgi:SnoaL-like domain